MKYVYSLTTGPTRSVRTINCASPLNVRELILAANDVELTVAVDDARAAEPPKILVAHFDVTGLSDDEIDLLTGEVTCQAEASDNGVGHPDVAVQTHVEVYAA